MATRRKTKKKRSTNPFDSSDSSTSSSEDENCGRRRSAPLDFNVEYDKDSAPALQFHQIQCEAAFVSPLESALGEELGPAPKKSSSWEDIPQHETESTPLLSDSFHARRGINSPNRPESYPGLSMGQWKSANDNNSTKFTKKGVLMELCSNRDDGELTKDYYKMIRLENVGTAKSWLILLLPYLAVTFCLLLESNKSLHIAQYGSISGSRNCFNDNTTNYTIPIAPAPPGPCSYQFLPSDTAQFVDAQIPPQKKHSKHPTRGSAFESGIITTIPPAALELFADATFNGLSMQSMASIYRGEVSVSGILFQKGLSSAADGDDQWHIVATSRTERLAMACELAAEARYQCSSPQIMEILFSMPGSAMLSGSELRINVIYSNTEGPADSDSEFGRTFLFGNEKLYNMLDRFDVSHYLNKEDVLSEIVDSSRYIVSYTNPLALSVDVWGRLFSIGLTVGFGIFWLRRLGFQGFWPFSFSSISEEDGASEFRRAMLLLDSPWVSFPERWYILVMMISLVLIQGPLLVLMHFIPSLNTMATLKTASDTLVGVGVNGVLFAYLCLFQGFGYHTAQVARKWMYHQKKVAEIKRAAKYVVGGNDGDNEDAIMRYTAEHFELHGDTDGTASLVNMRLLHDPFGDNWADFLLSKVLIFCVGVGSIWTTAYCRFHFTADAKRIVSKQSLQTANTIYLLGYVVHFSILILWLYKIFRSSISTGEKLRREPFLATRAAQLAYRVLFVHITLGFLAFAFMFFVWLEGMLNKWRGGEGSAETVEPSDSMDFWLQTMSRISRRFPYSGTAASIGFGRIFFATVSVLIAAFIFLPPKTLDMDELDAIEEKGSNPNREEQLRQRSDKRSVVTLLRMTHTWRVLPLPMERASAVEKIMLPQRFYQLYESGKKDYDNLQDPGIVAIGKYIPVFCVELACWLLEASFQAYYSPKSVDWNDSTPGRMDLNSIGLRLESAILDETTNTQCFIATNMNDQMEGEEDSLIIVSFRGSVDVSNIRTDLKSGMVALPDQLIGFDKAPFKVTTSDVLVEESGGWIWNTQVSETHTVSCYSGEESSLETECLPFGSKRKLAAASAVSSGAIAVLSATPVARNTLPCVHEGFNEVYGVLRKQVILAVLPVLQRQLSKAMGGRMASEPRNSDMKEPLLLPKIFLTGHSLGGALAQLLALDLASNCELVVDIAGSNSRPAANPVNELFQLPTPPRVNPPESSVLPGGSSKSNSNERLYLQPPIAVYTFGQPRVGNRAFSRLYKQRVPHTFRVATEGDPITSLPNVACAGIYKHAGLEVVLDEGETGNTLVGPTIVESLFRFHRIRTDYTAHSTDKYRDCLESALAPNELQEYYRSHSGKNTVGTGYGTVQRLVAPEVPDWMTQGRSSGRE